MNGRRLLPLLVLIPLLRTPFPAGADTGIIVNGAEHVRDVSVVPSPDLLDAAGRTAPRVVVDHANTIRLQPVAAPPGPLWVALAQVSPRIVLQYANTMREERIAAPPSALQTLFGQVASRIVLQYANTSREVKLAYPAALIGDTTRPQITNVQAQSMVGGVEITWITNEFATSEVRYGTTPGAYTGTASDPLFEKSHTLTLRGLSANLTYYFVVRGADRSGNQAATGEHQFKLQTKLYLYLPMLRR